MFSGLIADLGEVKEIDRSDEGARFVVATSLASGIRPGDSVAVNGVCLTATEAGEDSFTAEAMQQTLGLTSLGRIEKNTPVNLELALRADQRLAGHIVQGHVDGVGQIASLVEDGFSLRVRVKLPEALSRYVVAQGSITLEGVSLTVTGCAEGWVEVALIPETRERTSLGGLEVGQSVNIECDVLAKYVERMVSPYVQKSDPSSNVGAEDVEQ